MKKLCLYAILLMCIPAQSQLGQPSETLILSLKTVSKALAGCREVYSQKSKSSSVPILKLVLPADDYSKSMKNLDLAEGLVNGSLAHPNRVTGTTLVSLLSTMDDVSIAAGSTRFEILSTAVSKNNSKVNEEDLIFLSEAMNSCQKSLFNAGDDYVGLVIKYVDAEEAKLRRKNSNN